MDDQNTAPPKNENRAAPRTIVSNYYSVEFQVKGAGPIYQFKLWDESAFGLSILVKETSSVLNLLSVDDTLEMKYIRDDPSETPSIIKTRIVHITKQDAGRFSGHCLIGLATHPTDAPG